MFDEMISWGELIVLVLFVLGSALLFYLILAVSNLLRILKNVNQILDKNKKHIDSTIEKLPEISDNTAKVTGMLKDNMETIGKVIDDVGKVSDTIKKGVDTIQNDVILKAKSIVDIIDAIKSFFDKKKENRKKKKGTVYKYKYKPGNEKPDEVEIIAGDKEDAKAPKEYVEVKTEEEPADKNINVEDDEYKAPEED